MDYYIRLPVNGIPTYATASEFPTTSYNGAQAIDLSTDTLYIFNGTSWIAVATPGAAIAIDGLIGDVAATGPGVVTATIQPNVVSNAKLAQMPANTIKGNNTGSTANAVDLTVAQVNTMLGTTGAVTSVGPVGAAPNANAAVISGQVLTLEPADGSNPGVLTAGTQTIGGAKTLTGNLTLLFDASDYATLGVDSTSTLTVATNFNATTGNGGNLNLNSGTAGAVSGGIGGTVQITAGNGTPTGAGGVGGSVNINTGSGGINGSGGGFRVVAGNGTLDGAGGGISLNSGTGGPGSGTAGAAGGNLVLVAGTGGIGSATSGQGGAATLFGGNAGAGVAGGIGGAATLQGGAGGSGSASGGHGGNVQLLGGAPGAIDGSTGGAVAITAHAGATVATGGPGGGIVATTGAAGGDNTVNRSGGAFTLTLGASKGSATGATITQTAGAGGVGTGTLGANGGSLTASAGAGGVGSATGGVGGDHIINGGLGGNSTAPGAGGRILLQTATTTALATRMTILPSGNVGVGTATPATLFDVNGISTLRGNVLFGTDAAYDIGVNGGNRVRNVYASGTLKSSGTGSQSTVEITGAGGSVYWYPNSASVTGQIKNPSDGVIRLANGADTDFNRLQFGGTTSSFPALKRSTTNLAVRLADDSADAGLTVGSLTTSGNVGIGTTSPASFTLQVAGSVGPNANNASDLGSSILAWRNIYSVNAVTVTSDARSKQNVAVSDLGIDFINKLNPVSYQIIDSDDQATHYGLIAQEVDAINGTPDDNSAFVSYDADSDTYGIRYSELIAPLIKSVQELSAQVVDLQGQVAALKK